MGAVKRFISMPPDESGKGLCYTWPEYILRDTDSSEFWNCLHKGILDDLREERILRSQDEDTGFLKPPALRYVPTGFRFDGGTLFDLASIRRSHLAFNYDVVKDQLEQLGVQKLSIRDLYEEFLEWIEIVGVAEIQAQSTAWHRKVASLFSDRMQLRKELRALPIIPLRDGSWAKAKTKHLYFDSGNEDEHVPTGVDIFIVDPAASQDPKRRHFFEFLGIGEYTPLQVCELILELHADGSPQLSKRADEDLVTDAAYLFHHRSLLEEDEAPEIFFVVENDGELLRRKSQIYIINSTVGLDVVAKYRHTPGNPFPVLYERYEDAICKGKERTKREFHEWLLRSGMSRFTAVPTLVHNAKLTTEWAFLRKENVTDLLLTVKWHWENNSQPPRLIKAVPELKVKCRDGKTRSLGLSAIPTKKLLRECPHLNFADLPNPTSNNWSFLSEFGIPITTDTTAMLRELQGLSKIPFDEIDKESVHKVYRALNSSPPLYRDEIR